MKRPLQTVSGKPTSVLIFGAMQFGGTADQSASEALFHDALEAGINHFDTAFAYTAGASETILGGLIKNNREDIYLATKVGYVGGAGSENIKQQFSTSQQRLDADYVDLLYMHRFDAETPLDETYETLAELQSEGKVRHIGVSNYAAWQVMKAQAVMRQFGTRIDALQPMYSLVKRQAEVELLPMCLDQGILPATYSPLGGGLLTGKYASGGAGRLSEDHRYAARYGVEWMHAAAQGLTEIANELGVSPACLAVSWVLKSRYHPNPIVSARNVDQLRPSLTAATFDMSDELYSRLSALTPKPAPATDRLEEA